MKHRTTKLCYVCKASFRYEELIDYAGPNAAILHSYCPACLKEKQARDQFSIKVCQIFGLKSPGPRIWTERKRLQDLYGYTDDTIIDCLEYIYNVEHSKKLSESLCLITPVAVNKMLAWKRREQAKSNAIVAAYQVSTSEHLVQVQENNKVKKEEWNPDDWLED